MEHTAADKLRTMPKVDLHVHLDGSVRPETLIELARSSGASLPAWEPEKLAPYMKVMEQCESLAEYLEKFHFIGEFLHTAEALERTAFELVEDASRHHCRYIEVRFAPQLHRKLGLTAEEAIRHVIAGLRRAEAATGTTARCIAIALRGHSEEQNREVMHAAARHYGQGLVAVDLAGAEAAYPPELYEGVFALARELGLPATIHAGEAAGASSVETAVKRLGAVRIGHGVRMRENSAVAALVKDRRIPLEMCPISNMQTRAASDWSSYPLRDYFDQGYLVTVNTDNLTVSNTDISKEYAVLRDRLGFTDSELCRIALNGAEAAFLPESEKSALIERMRAELNDWLH